MFSPAKLDPHHLFTGTATFSLVDYYQRFSLGVSSLSFNVKIYMLMPYPRRYDVIDSLQ